MNNLENNFKELDNKYKTLLNKYNNLSKDYDLIRKENYNLKNELALKEKNIINDLENKHNIEINNLNNIIKTKDEIIVELNKKCDDFVEKISEQYEIEKKMNEANNQNLKIMEEKKQLEKDYNNLKSENLTLKNELNNMKHTNFNLNNDFKIKKNENEIKNIQLINSLDKLNDNLQIKDKEILRLSNIIKKYKKIIEKNSQEDIDKIEINSDININEHKVFCKLYENSVNKNILKNKIKLIIGIFVKKNVDDLNKKLEQVTEKNEKLNKINKKLNDLIVEYKINLLKENSK